MKKEKTKEVLEKIENVKNMLTNGNTNEEIMKELNFNTYSGMKSFCYRHDININLYRNGSEVRAYEFTNYMEDLNFLYYLAGLIASDGTIEDEGRNRVRIGLNKKDEEILYKLKNKIFKNAETVNMYERENGYRVDGTLKESTTLSISDKNLIIFLKSLGITKNKTKTLVIKEEDIPTQYMHHFIRGYFDGDGSVSVSENIKTGNIYLSCSLVGGNGSMEMIHRILNNNGIECKITDVTKEKYTFPFFEIRITSNIRCGNFYNYIYDNDNDFYLKRKKEKFKYAFSKIELKK